MTAEPLPSAPLEPIEPPAEVAVPGAATVDASPPTPGRLFVYSVVRSVLVGFAKLFWRLEVHGEENVPKQGAFILAPVHRSNIDTAIICAVTKRRMRYIGKDSMWKYKLPAFVFTLLGGWPVHRGTADRESMRRAADRLREGEPIVVFPEGRRQSGPLVAELFDGPAYMSARAGAPIVPVGIGGSERAMPTSARMIRPGKVVLVVGPPIEPASAEGTQRPPRRVIRETTARLREVLQELFDEAMVRAG